MSIFFHFISLRYCYMYNWQHFGFYMILKLFWRWDEKTDKAIAAKVFHHESTGTAKLDHCDQVLVLCVRVCTIISSHREHICRVICVWRWSTWTLPLIACEKYWHQVWRYVIIRMVIYWLSIGIHWLADAELYLIKWTLVLNSWLTAAIFRQVYVSVDLCLP